MLKLQSSCTGNTICYLLNSLLSAIWFSILRPRTTEATTCASPCGSPSVLRPVQRPGLPGSANASAEAPSVGTWRRPRAATALAQAAWPRPVYGLPGAFGFWPPAAAPSRFSRSGRNMPVPVALSSIGRKTPLWELSAALAGRQLLYRASTALTRWQLGHRFSVAFAEFMVVVLLVTALAARWSNFASCTNGAAFFIVRREKNRKAGSQTEWPESDMNWSCKEKKWRAEQREADANRRPTHSELIRL